MQSSLKTLIVFFLFRLCEKDFDFLYKLQLLYTEI